MAEAGAAEQTARTAGSAGPGAAIGADFLQRAERVKALGYRSVEAEFLTAAALLGGFFARRQFRAFSGAGKGGAEVRLARRAAANGHLKANSGKPLLYRLCGASLFQAAGCEDPGSGSGRARRAVKQRLLVLDYWISNTGKERLLLSAADKEAYFASLGIGQECFPAAVRTRRSIRTFFPDRFPIRVADQRDPRVRFTYAHAGSSERGINRHLESHERLAVALAERGIACEWVVLADSQSQFARLRHAWGRWLSRVQRDWSEGEYFELRLLVDKRRWKDLSRESAERYALLSTQHGGAAVERRYRDWACNGAPARKPGGNFPEFSRYCEVLMEFDYSAADVACR